MIQRLAEHGLTVRLRLHPARLADHVDAHDRAERVWCVVGDDDARRRRRDFRQRLRSGVRTEHTERGEQDEGGRRGADGDLPRAALAVGGHANGTADDVCQL